MLPGPVAAKEDRDARRTPVVRAVQSTGAAVVNIFTEEAPRTLKNPFRGFLGDSFFNQFFGNFLPDEKTQRRSLGSGVLIDAKGHILTNEHVIAKAVRIQVTLQDNREFEAQLIGADVRSDLAVIQIDSDRPLPHIPMGRSDDLMIGETVIAIGNPFGLHHTVTQGIISALHRTVRVSREKVYSDFIQVDASINPGNSGGPLLNINGSLIGVNTAIFQQAEGIGFAIPIDTARRIVKDLMEFGEVRRGWLGAMVQELTPRMAEFFKRDRRGGVIVTQVHAGSPAARAGLRQGDIITSIGDHSVTARSDYFQALSSYTVDDVFQLGFLHGGKMRSVRVRATDIPAGFAAKFARQWLGVDVAPLDAAAIRQFNLAAREGVVIVKVEASGPCGRVGIQRGDVIRRVNRHAARTLDDFYNAVLDAGKLNSVVLLVQRGRAGYYVTLEP